MTPDEAREIAIRALKRAADALIQGHESQRLNEAAAVLEAQANVEEGAVTLNVKASIRRCGCGKCGTGWLIIQGDDETAPHGFLTERDCPTLANMKPNESIPVSITVGQANVEEEKAVESEKESAT